MVKPDNFGEINGTCISNKDTVLTQIDNILGMSKPPDIEYIITLPFGLLDLPGNLGAINYNSFGHSALRYIRQDGKDVIVNIEGKENGERFIKIYDTKEYLYGTDPRKCGAQRGVYNRNIIGLRVENVPKEYMEQLDKYIKELELNEYSKYKFNIFFGPVLNLVKLINPQAPEYGNCARWSSMMLSKAGLVTNIYVWPKTVFINMFENYSKTNIKTQSNMNVVLYSQPVDLVENLAYGVKNQKVLFDTIAPLQSIRNWFYKDLKIFANCEVKIKPDTINAIPYINPNPAKPSELRNILNSTPVIFASIIGSICTYRYGYKKIRKFI